MRSRHLLMLTTLLPLWACSGGGGGSSGGGGGPVAAAPTPTPGSTYTPPPVNARFTAEGAGGVVGLLSLIVGEDPFNFGTDSAQLGTDLSGSVLVGTTRSPYLTGGGQTAGFPGFDYSANYALNAYGVENPTRIPRTVAAPRKSTTASPLTTLIALVGDQADVKRAFGLGSTTTFRLPAGLDLTTYSATQDLASGTPKSEPGQVLAANLRVLAIAQASAVFLREPGSPAPFGMDMYEPWQEVNQRIAAYIKANPTATLASADGVRDFLRTLRPAASPAYRDDVFQRAGVMVHAFNLATRLVDTNPSYASRFGLGVVAVLRPYLDDLAERNDPTGLAVGPIDPLYYMDIISSRLSDQLAFPAGSLLPVPDFLRLAKGGTLTIFQDPGPGNGWAPRPNMTGNDVLWERGAMTIPRTGIVRSIAVPAASADAITATLQTDGSVVVTAKPGFTSGLAWYDYVVEIKGLTETGRVYLLVR